MRDLEKHHENVRTKEDFLVFMDVLLDDLKKNPSKWENITLSDYLEAVRNWTEDMDGYYINTNQPVPENVSWSVFADILSAARIYE